MHKLERNILAAYYSRLASLAFERHQWELANDYIRKSNLSLTNDRTMPDHYTLIIMGIGVFVICCIL